MNEISHFHSIHWISTSRRLAVLSIQYIWVLYAWESARQNMFGCYTILFTSAAQQYTSHMKTQFETNFSQDFNKIPIKYDFFHRN